MTVTISLALARRAAESIANYAMDTRDAESAQAALDIASAIRDQLDVSPGVVSLVENDLLWIANQ